jgi:hypothetical protein
MANRQDWILRRPLGGIHYRMLISSERKPYQMIHISEHLVLVAALSETEGLCGDCTK